MKKYILKNLIICLAIIAPFIFWINITLATETNPATNVTDTYATLNGHTTDTNAWFEYGTDFNFSNPSLTTSTIHSSPSFPSGNFSKTISGLTNNTTYYFHACSSNMNNNNIPTCSLTPQAFNASSSINNIITNPVNANTITGTSATITGQIIATAPTKAWVQYQTTNNWQTATVPTGASLVTTAANGSFTNTITGLVPDTTYYFRICALIIPHTVMDECGDDFGDAGLNEYFTTPSITGALPTAPPIINTKDATGLNTPTVTLNGEYNTTGSTNVWFEYGLTSNFGTTTAPDHKPSSSGILTYSKIINVTAGNSNYYYRFCGSNPIGQSCGLVWHFNNSTTGQGGPPTTGQSGANISPTTTKINAITTSALPANITATEAQLNGSVSFFPNSSGNYFGYFRYVVAGISQPPIFCNNVYSSQIYSTKDVAVSGSSSGFNTNITGLQPNTQYYYCGVVSNNASKLAEVEIKYGSVGSFITKCDSACTIIQTQNAQVTNQTSAELNGIYNSTIANSTTTINPIKTWFDYRNIIDTTDPISYGNWISSIIKSHLSGSSGDISATISGLSPSTTYQNKAMIEADSGTTYAKTFQGDILTFRTPAENAANNNADFVIDSISDKTVDAGSALTFTATTSGGATGVGVTYSVSNLPANATFDLTTGEFNWTPTESQAGFYLMSIGSNSGSYTAVPITVNIIVNSLNNDGSCPTGWTGIYPVCTGPNNNGFCPSGWTGIYPVCTAPNNSGSCPSGWTGTYPVCTAPNNSGSCPSGWTGTYPVCTAHNNSNTTKPKVLKVGSIAKPPIDATVHYGEGIETVFARQIVANKTLAKTYGYQEGTGLQSFAWNLADTFARVFGYINTSGKEIRVSKPNIAAYQLEIVGKKLTVYEYYNKKIVNIQQITTAFKNANAHEYYFQK